MVTPQDFAEQSVSKVRISITKEVSVRSKEVLLLEQYHRFKSQSHILNKQHRVKVQLKARFHLNGHTIEFHPQAHDLELHTNLLLCKSAAGEVSSTQWRIQTFRLGAGGGRGHPDPEIRGGQSPQFFFSVLRASFWSKNKGGARAPRAPPLDPPLLQAQKSELHTKQILPCERTAEEVSFPW